MQAFFNDGSATSRVEVEYPLGHRRRRAEAHPLLLNKFETSLHTRFPPKGCQAVLDFFADRECLVTMPVDEFMNCLLAHRKWAGIRP